MLIADDTEDYYRHKGNNYAVFERIIAITTFVSDGVEASLAMFAPGLIDVDGANNNNMVIHILSFSPLFRFTCFRQDN